MYEYRDMGNESNNNENTGFVMVPEVNNDDKAAKKAAKKAERKKTTKKFIIGALVGLTFGVFAGAAFILIKKVDQYFFPDKKAETVISENDDTNEDVEEAKTEKKVTKAEDAKKVLSAEDDKKEGKVMPPPEGPEMITGVSAVAKNAMPSIVSITTKSVQEVRSMFGMGIQQYESEGAGSGIIIYKDDEELLLVTNNHVIEDANEVSVGFVDDEVYEAQIRGKDSDNDVAVLSVKVSDVSEDTLSKISVIEMGDSGKLVVGEQVVAIGNALGYGQSVTTGIVSALDREFKTEDYTSNLIQTDAAINPGNSGGALLNMKGQLIGINSAKYASTTIEGMGYAIPISTVEPIIEELMNRETREKLDEEEAGYLGISGVSVNSSVSEMYGIPEGVFLSEVGKDSPAEKAGLLKGDVIKKFDGVSVKSIKELREMIACYKPGETVDIIILRQEDGEYKEKTVSAVLGKREKNKTDNEKTPDDGEESKDDNSYVYEWNGNMDEFPFGDFFGFGR